jgi:hypothetical protein
VGLQVPQQSARVDVLGVDRLGPTVRPRKLEWLPSCRKPAGQHLREHGEWPGLVTTRPAGEVGVVPVALPGEGDVQGVVDVVVPLGAHATPALRRSA